MFRNVFRKFKKIYRTGEWFKFENVLRNLRKS